MKNQYGILMLLFLLLCATTVRAAERWEYFVPGNDIHDAALQGEYIWCATNYSIVRWDRQDMSYVQYTPRDYGAPRQYGQITADTRGNLWLGGAYRYDGFTWAGLGGNQAPPDVNGLSPLGPGPAGEVWFTTGIGALARFDGAVWSIHTLKDSLQVVNGMATDRNGVSWFAASCGLASFNGSSWRIRTVADGLPGNYITAIGAAEDNGIWFISAGKLCHLRSDSLSVFEGPEDINSSMITNLAVDKTGKIWTTSAKWTKENDVYRMEGVWRFSNGTWELLPLPDAYSRQFRIFKVLADEAGIVWFAASCGLLQWKDGVFTFYRTNTPVSWNCADMAEDSDGAVWLSGNAPGSAQMLSNVSRYSAGKWTNYDGFDGPEIYASGIGVDALRRIWFLGSDLLCYDQGMWKTELTHDNIHFGVSAFLADKKGKVWFGTPSQGLVSWNNGVWEDSLTFSSNSIHALALGKDGEIWIGTEDGIVKLMDGSVQFFHETDTPVVALAVDPNGILWAATYRSFLRFDGETWTEYAKVPGMNRLSPQCIAVDNNGVFWAGDWDCVLRFDGRVWKRYTEADGLLAGRTTKILVDRQNCKWFSTWNGICILDDTAPQSVFESTPAPFALLGNFPNPFNASTLITFTLPAQGKTTLTVYDINGRKVRALVSGRMNAGTHSEVWDGRDNSGREVSSGVYFARLTMGERTAVRKMALMK